MTTKKNIEAEVHEWAVKAFKDHVITVEHEHGLYRHYRCAQPGTVNLHFHIVTFPGRLIVCGDIGDMAWERCPDMLEWAKGSLHSTSYFAEKVWRCIETEEFSKEVAQAEVERQYQDAIGDMDGDDSPDAVTRLAALEQERDELLVAADDDEHAFISDYYASDWYGGDFPNCKAFTREFLRCREAVRWFLANRG